MTYFTKLAAEGAATASMRAGSDEGSAVCTVVSSGAEAASSDDLRTGSGASRRGTRTASLQPESDKLSV